MHCQLLLPDLFWPDADFRGIYGGLATPALLQLLGKGRRKRTEAVSAEAWLCQRFDVEKQSDWPVAPYTLLADGGEPGADYWLRADPVHLKLEGGRLLLADSGTFSISQTEAENLTDSLNAHFAADGLTFHPLRPERWYLRTESAPALETTELAAALGRSIDELLPQSGDAQAWRTRLNDAQMLLQGHAVNEAREGAGQAPINSVWFWGGGMLSDTLSAPFDALWSQDPLAKGLAQTARIAVRDRPAGAMDFLRASASEGVALVLLDQLRGAAQYGDAHGWREALLALERDWFAPLLAVLRQERIGMLSLHAPGPQGVLSAEVTRGDLRRFWRRVKPLADYA